MRALSVVAVAAVLLLSGCETGMGPSEHGDPGSESRVLIAGSESEFRAEVVRLVVSDLVSDGYYVQVTGLAELLTVDRDQHGAILVVAAYKGGDIDRRVVRFLENDPGDQRVVVFYTVGNDVPKPESAQPDIRTDAVSSASRPENATEISRQLSALVRARFE
jgi:hypothetical protein